MRRALLIAETCLVSHRRRPVRRLILQIAPTGLVAPQLLLPLRALRASRDGPGRYPLVAHLDRNFLEIQRYRVLIGIALPKGRTLCHGLR